MKKTILSILFFLTPLLSISANSQFLPPKLDEVIYLDYGEQEIFQFYPNDRVYEIELQRSDLDSFETLTISLRGFLHTNTSENCNFGIRLFTVDDDNNWIDEYISGIANSSWSDWLEVDVNMNVYSLRVNITHTCKQENPGKFELEILLNGIGNVPPPQSKEPTINLRADDQTIDSGTCTYLRWDVYNASNVYLNGETVSSSGNRYICPTYSNDYELEVYGNDGNLYFETVTVYVEEPSLPPPELVFWADDYQITSGECVYIYWQIREDQAESVWFNGTSVPHDLYERVCPNSTSTYTLEVLGFDGNYYSESLTISVDEPYLPPPELVFWADDYQITRGECVYIYWQIREDQAESVWFNGTSVPYNLYERVCPTNTTTYTLDVLGFDGNYYSDSLTIYVNEAPEESVPAPLEPESPSLSIDNFWADRVQLRPNFCTNLWWSVEGAQTVILEGPTFRETVTYNTDRSKEVCPSETSEYILIATDMQGNQTTSTVTIYVEEFEINCIGDDEFLLIVTDSSLLNASTGDSSTWKDVKSRLENYYGSSADGCLGKPFFLDIAGVKTETNPGYKSIDQAIERFVKDMRVDSPSAIAIIGGPNVIPYNIIPNKIINQILIGDDFYADFDNDAVPDTVLTRLPDGGYKEVLINYIKNFTSYYGILPDDRALLVTDLSGSAHRLQQYHDLYLSKPSSNISENFLEDYIKLQTNGEVINIMTPPIAGDHYYGYDEYRKVIRGDDVYNSDVEYASSTGIGMPVEGVEKYLNSKYIIFGDFTTTNDLGHYISLTPVGAISNIFQDQTYESPMDYDIAPNFIETSQVFSLASQSALIRPDIDGSYQIPIQALAAGVHHFIGRMDNNTAYRNTKFTFDGLSYGDISLDRGAGKFAASFFSRSSGDPATSFWQTKKVLYASGDTHTAFSFSYLGLPEKQSRGFGKYNQTMVEMDIKPGILTKPPASDTCKSHNPKDCDGDKIPDDEEFYLASIYAPYIVPDEGEDSIQLPRNHGSQEPFGVFWQVSPAEYAGKRGAWITYVFSYTRDAGIHYVDMSFLNCISCLNALDIDFCNCRPWDLVKIWNGFSSDYWKNQACCAGELAVLPITLSKDVAVMTGVCTLGETINESLQFFDVNVNPNQTFFGHPGDNEAFRIFIWDDGSEDWSLTHINWKRHHEGFDDEGMLQSVAEAKSDGLTFYQNTYHPLLFASQNKHAMYPTAKICEDYEMEFVSGCTITFEDCGGHPNFDENNPIKTRIIKDFNVGEREGTYTVFGVAQEHFNLREKLDPVFPDEYAWKTGDDDYFCGNINPGGGLGDEDCGGPMGKLWYPKDSSWSIEF